MSNPRDLIDQKRLVGLTQTMVSIPSVTGQEQRLSDWMYNHFQSIGLQDVHRLPVEDSLDFPAVVGW